MEEERQFAASGASNPHLSSYTDQIASTLSIPMTSIKRPHSRHTYNREPSYASLASPRDEYGQENFSADKSGAVSHVRNNAASESQSDRQHLFGRVASTNITRRPHIVLNWWQEMAACVLTVAALMALFATLYAYTNKPSPDWPSWLSLNTIVSIYIVLLKAGILLVTAEGLGQLKWSWFTKDRSLQDIVKYDNASRGPSGALALVWRLRTRHILASFGALITILALVVDPFAQQIVRYYDCTISVPDAIASIPRTNIYYEEGALHTGALYQSIVPAVQNAINEGVFSSSTSVSAQCLTGNCTWTSEYSTVGWCSACDDITSLLHFENVTFHEDRDPTWNLTTSIPGGLKVIMSPGVTQEYAAMGASPSSADSDESAFTASIDFVLGKDLVGNVDPTTGNAFPDCNSTAANQTWKCQGYGASRCQFYPCVKTYAGSVSTGKLSETLLSSGRNWGYGSGGAFTTLDTDCIDADERQSLLKLGYKINKDERWLAYNETFAFSTWPPLNNTFPESMLIRDCLYAADLTFMNSLEGYIETLFTGTVTGPIVAPEEPLGQFSGPQIIQSIFNFGDITFDRMTESMANVTESLTNYMRQNGGANFSTPAAGVTAQSKTCIAVHWAFLSFPAVLTLMTLVFFALMVLETRPTGARPEVWKSSPLALLYHGLAGQEGSSPKDEVVEDLNHLGSMQALAEATRVRLVSSHDDVVRLEVQHGAPEVMS